MLIELFGMLIIYVDISLPFSCVISNILIISFIFLMFEFCFILRLIIIIPCGHRIIGRRFIGQDRFY
jgi:hypothetical protein